MTHRAFCDALAQESVRAEAETETTPLLPSSKGSSKEQGTVASSSSSPPQPPLTPSTSVLSPVLSIQSSGTVIYLIVYIVQAKTRNA